jgi:hypothetical protein
MNHLTNLSFSHFVARIQSSIRSSLALAAFVTVALSVPPSTLFAASAEALLARHFMASEVTVVVPKSRGDLALAQYSEVGPTVAVLVAESSLQSMYLAEINDVGAILVLLNRDTDEVTTIKQDHSITCDDISLFSALDDGMDSICSISHN